MSQVNDAVKSSPPNSKAKSLILDSLSAGSLDGGKQKTFWLKISSWIRTHRPANLCDIFCIFEASVNVAETRDWHRMLYMRILRFFIVYLTKFTSVDARTCIQTALQGKIIGRWSFWFARSVQERDLNGQSRTGEACHTLIQIHTDVGRQI